MSRVQLRCLIAAMTMMACVPQGNAAGGPSPAATITKPSSAAQTKTPLTPQQQKMKDCGAKWQAEKKAKGVRGAEAWNKFRKQCLKS